jgi:hypothetical protein
MPPENFFASQRIFDAKTCLIVDGWEISTGGKMFGVLE